jgi:hypothetical protein
MAAQNRLNTVWLASLRRGRLTALRFAGVQETARCRRIVPPISSRVRPRVRSSPAHCCGGARTLQWRLPGERPPGPIFWCAARLARAKPRWQTPSGSVRGLVVVGGEGGGGGWSHLRCGGAGSFGHARDPRGRRDQGQGVLHRPRRGVRRPRPGRRRTGQGTWGWGVRVCVSARRAPSDCRKGVFARGATSARWCTAPVPLGSLRRCVCCCGMRSVRALLAPPRLSLHVQHPCMEHDRRPLHWSTRVAPLPTPAA